MIYDLSPVVGPDTPVWPGDTPFSSRLTWSMADGAPVNVSAFTTTPHLGSHADAPFHTERRGEAVGSLPLEPFLGPCRVVKVPSVPKVEPRHLGEVLEGDGPLAPPRILLRTDSVLERRGFPERFTVLSPELASLLADRGALLVGVDTPSVDPLESKALQAHHALLGRGVAILEGLVLDAVPAGIYELIAPPLKIAGLDASPVRAVLRTLDR